jgi:hypothetical protein
VTNIIYLILIHLVTPKARVRHEPFVQQTGLWLLDPICTNLSTELRPRKGEELDQIFVLKIPFLNPAKEVSGKF